MEHADRGAVSELADELDSVGVPDRIAERNTWHAKLFGKITDDDEVLLLVSTRDERIATHSERDAALVHDDPVAMIDIAIERAL